ncbi:Predicted dehydrogenase [Shouchella lonarensis]|uniref:Predicted dehydrogenase n=1 Tax=Shouchella lonarensis TaxID=1464122 RepID=A0A1G6KX66_9BACI|nr:Predicted dehydrogenase [Shouchella lonarensis]
MGGGGSIILDVGERIVKLKLGIIGCGQITEKHCQALASVDQIAVKALSDLSRERMHHIAYKVANEQTRHTFISLYDDYRQMLANEELDIILVATSSGVHAEMVQNALEAGKHVIVEKPLALSLSESRLLSQLAKDKRRLLLVCYQRRYMNAMMKLKGMINEGLLGEIYYGVGTITVNRSEEYYEQVPWRGTWAQDGGMLVNQGIHIVDLLVWLLGDVSQVYGNMMRVKPYKETEDVAFGLLHFKNGAHGLIEANTISLPNHNDCSLKIFAEKGVVTIRGSLLDKIESFEVVGVKVDEKMLHADGLERVRMYEAYVNRILGEKEDAHYVSGEDAERALETIFALYQSTVSKCPVQLPLTSFSTEKMKDHFEKGGHFVD